MRTKLSCVGTADVVCSDGRINVETGMRSTIVCLIRMERVPSRWDGAVRVDDVAAVGWVDSTVTL